MGLVPDFSLPQVYDRIDDFANDKIAQAISALAYVGESIVNRARDSGNYTDHTGNLRSSIGFVIIYNGDIVDKLIQEATGSTQGKETALQLSEDFSKKFNKGLVLVVFAGMEYAAAVESRDYDVLTGSQPMAGELLRELKKELF